jgi:beta-fructofuranosidase
VHWEQLPIALAMDEHPHDANGVWTGCVVEHDGKFYAFYTGIVPSEGFKQVQCLATSDDLTTWTKYTKTHY